MTMTKGLCGTKGMPVAHSCAVSRASNRAPAAGTIDGAGFWLGPRGFDFSCKVSFIHKKTVSVVNHGIQLQFS